MYGMIDGEKEKEEKREREMRIEGRMKEGKQ